ncbi:type IV secretory system conjugative DNA transfer family protein [Actinacidiphila glaucinigra]|uniref:type IV secretory system conjugative DNA transfer family protein n=1 Tax=Actinacidiphila glaucinigra TaxID=235986 RepID=UPI003724A8F3
MSRKENPTSPTPESDLHPKWVQRITRRCQLLDVRPRTGLAAAALPAVAAAGGSESGLDLSDLLGSIVTNWPAGGPVGFGVFALAGIGIGAWHIKDKLPASGAGKVNGNRAEGLATRKELRGDLSEVALKKRAKVLRPSMDGVRGWHLDPLDLGLQVGVDLIHNRHLFISCEDAVLVLAPPRSGKTAWLGGHVIDAAGACLVTSTRGDIYEHTEGLRRTDNRPVWVFNGGIAGVANTVRWNPVAGCDNPQIAVRRAGYILSASATGEAMENGHFWESNSFRLLRSYLMAGALAPTTKTLMDVRRWVSNPSNPEPRLILENAVKEDPEQATWLRGWLDDLVQQVNLPDRTRDSIFGTLSTSFEFLALPQVAEIVMPRPGEQTFDARDFLRSRGTLYLMGQNSRHGSVAPLFTCLVGDIYETAKAVAADSPQGRLDPYLRMVLDEAAIICPLPLHMWTADSGGWNIQILTSVQSRAQLFDRWGRWGGKTLWENTNNLVFGGLSDTDDLEELSILCGEKDEEVISRSTNRDGEVTSTSSYRRVRVMPPSEIRGMKVFTGLYFHRALPPIRVGYTAVWGRKDFKALGKARKKMVKLNAKMERQQAKQGVVMDKAPAGPPPMPTFAPEVPTQWVPGQSTGETADRREGTA